MDKKAIATPTSDVEETSKHLSKRAGRNVVLLVVAELLGKCATLAFTLVVARQLGATAFGSFSYALALGLLLATLISWGFDLEVARRGSENQTDLAAVLTQALVLRTIHAIPILLLGGIVAVSTRPDSATAQASILILLATTLDSYGDTGRAAATAREQPGRAAFALVAQRIAACFLAIFALALGGGLVAVAAGYLASSILGQVVLLVILRGMGLRLLPRSLTRDQLIRMWRNCFLTGIEVVLAMALFRIDALMLEAIAGARELGSYAVAYRLMETVLFVTWAVTRPMFPSMVRAGSGRPLLEVGENALAVVAAIFVPYGTILCIDGTALLRLIFGVQYAEGSTASLQWLAFAPLAFALHYCNSNLLFARARTRPMLAAIIIGLICNVMLNLILIREYGASGAAAATTLSYAVAGLVSTIFLLRKDGFLRMDRALFSAVAAALPMSAALIFFHLPVLLDICVAALVYLASYVALARWRSPGHLALLVSLVRRV